MAEKLFRAANLVPEQKDEIRALGQQIAASNSGLSRAAICKASKNVYKWGLRVQDLKAANVEEAPTSVKKAVRERVEKEIGREATEKVEQVLESGQSIETQLSLLAKLFKFSDTATFLKTAVVFYGTYFDRIDAERQENKVFRWAIQELLSALDPVARQRRIDNLITEYVTKITMAELSSGQVMPEDFIEKRITLLKENLK